MKTYNIKWRSLLSQISEHEVTYLDIIFGIGRENVLNINGIRCINLIAKRGNQSISSVFWSKINHVIMKSMEIKKLIQHGSSNWMIFLRQLAFSLLTVDIQTEKKKKICGCDYGDGKWIWEKIHGNSHSRGGSTFVNVFFWMTEGRKLSGNSWSKLMHI